MKVLIIGSADCLLADMERVNLSDFDKIIAVNKAFLLYPGSDFWITLHPENLQRWKPEGVERAKTTVVSFSKTVNTLGNKINYTIDETFPYLFDGQTNSGSSGMYAVKYAMEILKASEIVLAGVPMDPHIGHIDDASAWIEGNEFWQTWENMAWKLRAHNVKSLSGRTADLLA